MERLNQPGGAGARGQGSMPYSCFGDARPQYTLFGTAGLGADIPLGAAPRRPRYTNSAVVDAGQWPEQFPDLIESPGRRPRRHQVGGRRNAASQIGSRCRPRPSQPRQPAPLRAAGTISGSRTAGPPLAAPDEPRGRPCRQRGGGRRTFRALSFEHRPQHTGPAARVAPIARHPEASPCAPRLRGGGEPNSFAALRLSSLGDASGPSRKSVTLANGHRPRAKNPMAGGPRPAHRIAFRDSPCRHQPERLWGQVPWLILVAASSTRQTAPRSLARPWLRLQGNRAKSAPPDNPRRRRPPA